MKKFKITNHYTDKGIRYYTDKELDTKFSITDMYFAYYAREGVVIFTEVGINLGGIGGAPKEPKTFEEWIKVYIKQK